MSEFRYRLLALVPDGLQLIANQFAAQLDPDAGGAQTFGEAVLSVSGQLPGTWSGANSKLSEVGRQGVVTAIPQLEAMAQALGLPKPLAFVIDVSNGNEELGTLVHTNSNVDINQQWGWAQSLDYAGLQTIIQETD